MEIDAKPTEAKGTLPVPRDAAPATSSYTAGCAAIGLVVLFPALLYFGFFGAILVDELVLETGYIGRSLPRDVKDAAEFIYTPMFLLVEELGFNI